MVTIVREPEVQKPEVAERPRVDFDEMMRRFPHPTCALKLIVFDPRKYCPLGMLSMYLEGMKSPWKFAFSPGRRFPNLGEGEAILQEANALLPRYECEDFARRILFLVDRKKDIEGGLAELRRALEWRR